MNKYALTAATSVLGGFVLWLIGFLWFTFLTHLANHYSVTSRRRIASVAYVLLAMPLLGGSCVGKINILLAIGSPKFVLFLAFFISVAPSAYWFGKRWKILRALGYGRSIEPKRPA